MDNSELREVVLTGERDVDAAIIKYIEVVPDKDIEFFYRNIINIDERLKVLRAENYTNDVDDEIELLDSKRAFSVMVILKLIGFYRPEPGHDVADIYKEYLDMAGDISRYKETL